MQRAAGCYRTSDCATNTHGPQVFFKSTAHSELQKIEGGALQWTAHITIYLDVQMNLLGELHMVLFRETEHGALGRTASGAF
jgi:hypothetical protein